MGRLIALGLFYVWKASIICAGDYPSLRCYPSLFHDMLNCKAGVKQIVGQVFLRHSYAQLSFSSISFLFPDIFSLQTLHLMKHITPFLSISSRLSFTRHNSDRRVCAGYVMYYLELILCF